MDLTKSGEKPMPIIHNVCNDEVLKAAIERALEVISRTLINSLGPGLSASTTLIYGGGKTHQATKDGYTILKAMNFGEPVHKVVLDMVQEIALQLVTKVGDGSTSSIVASNFLYKEIKKLLDEKKYRPNQVMRALHNVSNDLIERLYELATPVDIDSDNLTNVASVSLNNDADGGALIGNMFKAIGKYGYVNILMGNRDKTFVEYPKDKGYEIEFPYWDKILINTIDGTCTLESPRILMFTGTLTGESAYDTLKNLIVNKHLKIGVPLVIFAQFIGRDIRRLFQEITTFADNNQAPRILNLVQIVNNSSNDAETLEDMAILLGCKIIKLDVDEPFDVDKLQNCYGQAKQVISDEKKTLIIGPQGDAMFTKDRIAYLQDRIAKLDLDANRLHDVEKFEYEVRLAKMLGSLANIVVGGRTEMGRHLNRYYIEDAISACRSAIRYGYVPGCNVAILKALEKSEYSQIDQCDKESELEFAVYAAIETAIRNVYSTIISNANPDATDKDAETIINDSIGRFMTYNLITERPDKSIINSVETDVQIIKAVVEIVGILVTSNQLMLPDTNICEA